VSAERPAPATPEQLYERLFGAGRTGAPQMMRQRRRVLAVIWATVDSERALADLGSAAVPLPDDALLGASVRLLRPADGDPVAVLEPNTEGRLAATLARNGEGPAGEYVEAPTGLESLAEAAAREGLALTRSAEGPFGRSVLVLSAASAGPHLVLVECQRVPSDDDRQ
jgi:hypothetical protein